MSTPRRELVLILDFGSQYTQLIARRIREAGVYCEIHPFNLALPIIADMAPRAIVFSGGPASVYGDAAPRVSPNSLPSACPFSESATAFSFSPSSSAGG